MYERKPEHKSRAALTRLPEFVEFGFFKDFPFVSGAQPGTGLASLDTAANDRADAGDRGVSDPVLVFAIQAGVRDLEGVEDA